MTKPLTDLKLPLNCSLVKKSENHHHYTCISSLFGFVDDLEILHEDGVFHILSESRVGYSDMDANRKRVEWVRSNN